MCTSRRFELKKDRDYIVMPITNSDMVDFDSSPANHYDYMRRNYGYGWEYKTTVDIKGVKCLLWGKWDDK